jgi:hypothetical protein
LQRGALNNLNPLTNHFAGGNFLLLSRRMQFLQLCGCKLHREGFVLFFFFPSFSPKKVLTMLFMPCKTVFVKPKDKKMNDNQYIAVDFNTTCLLENALEKILLDASSAIYNPMQHLFNFFLKFFFHNIVYPV